MESSAPGTKKAPHSKEMEHRFGALASSIEELSEASRALSRGLAPGDIPDSVLLKIKATITPFKEAMQAVVDRAMEFQSFATEVTIELDQRRRSICLGEVAELPIIAKVVN